MENEKRLIDANVVYEMGHRTPFHIGIADLCDLKELLEDVPTVDAVEVVRCKECKHCIYVSRVMGDVRCGKLHTDYIKENSFCSNGERKDNG